MKAHIALRLRVISLLAGASTAALLATSASAQCPGPCPSVDDPGKVVVDRRYDFRTPSDVLDSAEIECAINCLDTDPLPESALTFPTPQTIRGGVVEFLASPRQESGAAMTYSVATPIRLPAAVQGQLILRGYGAQIVVDDAWPTDQPVFVRADAASTTASNLILMKSLAQNWLIEGITFTKRNGPIYDGILLEGARGFTMREVVFHAARIGANLQDVEGAAVLDCKFANTRLAHVALNAGVLLPHYSADDPGTAADRAGKPCEPCQGNGGLPSIVASSTPAPGTGSAGGKMRRNWGSPIGHATASWLAAAGNAPGLLWSANYMDGDRAAAAILLGTAQGAWSRSSVMVKESYFFPGGQTCRGAEPIVASCGHSRIALDGVLVAGERRGFLAASYESHTGPDVSVTVNDIVDWGPVALMSPPEIHRASTLVLGAHIGDEGVRGALQALSPHELLPSGWRRWVPRPRDATADGEPAPAAPCASMGNRLWELPDSGLAPSPWSLVSDTMLADLCPPPSPVPPGVPLLANPSPAGPAAQVELHCR